MKIKKAFLIYPPTGFYMRDDRCQAPVAGMTAQPMRTPLDLAYMAAIMEGAGVECMIKDYPAEKKDWNQVETDIREFGPDMLVISITTPTLRADMMAAEIAKRIKRGILVVSKGAHYLRGAEDILKEYEDLDIIIRGESEFAMLDIATMDDVKDVPGITYRNGDSILSTPDRPLLEDLDKLPLPARHLLNNDLYLTPDTKKPLTLIYTGRGCPYSCIFCAVGIVSGHKVKQRSPDSIVKEIEECVNKYNIRDFFFRSDMFTWDEDWVIDICKGVLDKNLDIRWGTNSRVDTISKKRLDWMKRAGCWIVGFGMESGDQKSLDLMKKNSKVEDARNSVAMCKRFGIKVYMLFLIGLPWDDRTTITDTVRFIKSLDGDYIDVNIAYPLPGTELFEMAKKEGLFAEKDLYGSDHSRPVIRTRYLSTRELIDIRRKALLSFYLRPRYIIKTFRTINSPAVLFSYIKAGFGLVVKLFSRESNVVDCRDEL